PIHVRRAVFPGSPVTAARRAVPSWRDHRRSAAPSRAPDGGKTMRLHCSRRAAWLAAALLSLLPIAPAPAADPPYDLLVRNGRIIDGTGNPWYFGDVAVRGDRVVAVGRVPPGPARREIDARG